MFWRLREFWRMLTGAPPGEDFTMPPGATPEMIEKIAQARQRLERAQTSYFDAVAGVVKENQRLRAKLDEKGI